MANMSYLCGTNKKATYPSVNPAYDSDKQTIACDVWCVPLLWTALFRPADIVKKTFDTDDGKVVTEAPLVSRKKAMRQLEAALPYYNRVFAKEGPLDEYASFLSKALAAAKYTYVTIEMEEIAALGKSEQKYYDEFRAALGAIGRDHSLLAKRRLVAISQFRKLKKFPPARLLLDGSKAPDDDFWNHCRICGAGSHVAALGRRVPWEPR
jgi:hypothetical protein